MEPSLLGSDGSQLLLKVILAWTVRSWLEISRNVRSFADKKGIPHSAFCTKGFTYQLASKGMLPFL